MQVHAVQTENFRLLEKQSVEFAPGVNVITGENAQGKTTLLEAVYLLTGVKSFRTRFDKELIAFGADFASVSGKINACGRDQTVELLFQRGQSRKMKQNGVKRSAMELSENLKAVLFSPDDLGLVKGPAAGRRKLMDAAISQLRPGYARILSDYNKLYENKTRILRDWREKPALLDTLDEFSDGLCQCSARLIRYRASFARRLREAAEPIHRDFSNGREELGMDYATVSTVTDPEADLQSVYEQVALRQLQLRQAELEAGMCLVGAHKDDLIITINGADARSFASQGQTRTAALSIKMAERELFCAETGESPVLLLDDVLSELDAMRQEFVLNRIGGGQTLITCCEDDSISQRTGGRVLSVEKGRVS